MQTGRTIIAGLAVALAASAADAADKSRPAKATADPHSIFSVDDYPAEAIRAHQEGRVTTDLTIGPDGKVSDCGISISSGSAALDQTTCHVIQTRLVYVPAADAHGRAIPAHDSISIRWKLPEPDEATSPPPASRAVPAEDQRVDIEVAFDAQGLITGCRVARSEPTGPGVEGYCRSFPTGQKIVGFWPDKVQRRAGKVVFATSVTFTFDPASAPKP